MHLLLTCEHAGRDVPEAWRHLFRGRHDILSGHRGWDIGIRTVAETLADLLKTDLILTPVTRLLCDCNRSIGSPTVLSEFTRPLPEADRRSILDAWYHPYRNRVMAALDALTAKKTGPVLHLSLHSFTPVWKGRTRTTDLGVLYDPARAAERIFARGWRATLAEAFPELRCRLNLPYRGWADGLTTACRTRHPARAYLGLELEINQALLATKTQGRSMARRIAGTLAFGFTRELGYANTRESARLS